MVLGITTKLFFFFLNLINKCVPLLLRKLREEPNGKLLCKKLDVARSHDVGMSPGEYCPLPNEGKKDERRLRSNYRQMKGMILQRVRLTFIPLPSPNWSWEWKAG